MKKLLLFATFLISCGGSNPSYELAPSPIPPDVLITVKFCSDQIVSYPTSFPEYGFCYQSQLFAVFWDGTNAWMSEVPPGNYISTATGLQCNFTVSNNCMVQEN